MSEAESCKQSLEITVPVEEVDQETARVVESLKEKVRIPGFRPGKTPASVIRSKFAADIHKEVLESLIPKALREAVERDGLNIVGTPDITNVKFEKGEPLTFTAELEIIPEFELEEYRGLEVEYAQDELTPEDVDERLEQLREQKAEYLNVDPRPVADGDHAVVALKSVAGVEGEPIENDEMMLHVGAEDTIEDFSKNLTGMEPGQEKEFDVAYPEDYGQERLAGKTVRFQVSLKAIRQKEVPDLNDEFAQDLGDYKDLPEFREALEGGMRTEREMIAQQEARSRLVEKLVDIHDFPVPEVFVESQIEAKLKAQLHEMMAQGIDPRELKIDWKEIKASHRDSAIRDVKASMLLEKIGERESIEVTLDEVDQQVQRLANQKQEPVVAVRKELEESGEIRRIASRIRTEKTLNFLFEQSRKIAPKKEEK